MNICLEIYKENPPSNFISIKLLTVLSELITGHLGSQDQGHWLWIGIFHFCLVLFYFQSILSNKVFFIWNTFCLDILSNQFAIFFPFSSVEVPGIFIPKKNKINEWKLSCSLNVLKFLWGILAKHQLKQIKKLFICRGLVLDILCVRDDIPSLSYSAIFWW